MLLIELQHLYAFPSRTSMVKEGQRGGIPRVMQACEPLPTSQLHKSSTLVVTDAQACDGFACVWANSVPLLHPSAGRWREEEARSWAPKCCS